MISKAHKSSDIALKVEHVSKGFRLPTEQASGIKQAFINRMRGIKGYTEQQVLKDISFEVKKGDFFGIVGRNGSGKSTLLKLISQIYSPDSGNITVNGSLVPFIELGVGFNPELTGRENVYLNGAMLGFSKEEIDEMYDEIVEFAELHDFMDQKLKNYSSGMQVRLAFSVAIKAQGDILVLDEVLAVGDAAFQAKCFDYFNDLKNNNATVIFVSHDRTALERFCTKGVLIDNGQLIAQGPMKKVIDQYNQVVLRQMDGVNSAIVEEKVKNKSISLKNVELLVDNKKQKSITFGEKAVINTRLTFLETITNPIIGLTLWKRGIEDNAIYAANNITEGMGDLGVYGAGDNVSFSIALPDDINDGEYVVEIAVANESATNFYLQNRTAMSFKIFGSTNPHAILASSANMQLTKE